MRVSLYNSLRVRPSIPFAVRTGNAATNGSAVPLNYNSQNFRWAMVIFQTGTITDGTLAVIVEESANGTTGWTTIPTTRLEGALPAVTATDDDKTYEIGVVADPAFPFLRVTATQAAATTGGLFGATVLLGGSNFTPVVRP